MKLAIGLPSQIHGTDPAIIPTWAAQAERAGFSALATIGRIASPGIMDTVALAAAAASTHSAELISGILLGPVWPPVLLAKEAAGIDAISGGRLTLGLSVGDRPSDFVSDGHGFAGRGQRFDRDIDIYRRVWKGEQVGDGPNPAVTPGARDIPLLFGGTVAASFERVARWGTGYIAGAAPAPMIASVFEEARTAWDKAGRDGSPRLVAGAYFTLGDAEQGRGYVWDYYNSGYGNALADMVSEGVCTSPGAVKERITAFADIGATDFILHPTVGDLNEIARLADIVL